MTTLHRNLTPPALAELLDHAEWLRGLAAHLVRDDDPDDLVQETWIAALRSPPGARDEGPRPWLTTVLRNFARRRWRSDLARRAREELVAPPAIAATCPEELLARAQVQRLLADEVLALEEPFRTTVLLRYYEGKSAAEIARASGVPEGTVRWRVKTALDRLRARLDEAHDRDRRKWRALLVPLALPLPAAVATRSAGALVGGVAIVAALVGGLALLAQRAGETSSRAREARRPSPVARVVVAPAERAATATLSGIVRSPAGAPVAGAVVALACAPRELEARPMGPHATAVSDADGRFAFESIVHDACEVSATARGFLAASSPVARLAPGARATVELTLGAGGIVLSGRVLDEGGGPIPGAIVSAGHGYPWDLALPGQPRPQRKLAAIADEQGRYELTLPPREYTVRAEAGGYTRAETTVAVTRAVVRDLALAPAARLEGRVVERGTHRTIAGAEVVAIGPDQMVLSDSHAMTDADGRFVIDDAVAGALELRARHPEENLHGTARVVVLPAQRMAGLEIAVAPGVTITGRVESPTGEAVAGAGVNASEPGVRASARAVTDAHGRFTMGVAGAGAYVVMTELGSVVDGRARVNVEVGPSGVRDVRLVMAEPVVGGVVAGRILAADGGPAAGALVRAEARVGPVMPFAQTEADADGKFRFDRLPATPFKLVAWHPRHGFREVEATAASGKEPAPLVVQLEPGATIGGRVTYDDGRPAANVSVAATRQEGTVVYDSATTDEAGAFAIRSLAPGSYLVRATRKAGPFNLWSSGDKPSSKHVDVSARDQTFAVELQIARGGKRLAGVVVLPDGRPAAGARVVGHRASHGPGSRPFGPMVEHATSADEHGRWVLDDVEDEAFTIFATFPGYPEAQAATEAGRTDVRVAFAAPASIEGVVVDRDGRPVSAYGLSVTPAVPPVDTPEARQKRYASQRFGAIPVRDPQGVFRVEGLAADTYDVKIESPAGTATTSVALAAGDAKRGVRLTLGTPVTVRGKVVALESGEPLKHLTVHSSVDGRGGPPATTGEDGTFEMHGLAGGGELNVETWAAAVTDRVPEFVTVKLPREGGVVDAGTFALMKGDWRTRERTGGSCGARLDREGGRVVVRDVRPGSPADRAGLRARDVVVAVGDRDVTTLGPGAVYYLLREPPGTNITVTVEAGKGERKTVALELQAR